MSIFRKNKKDKNKEKEVDNTSSVLDEKNNESSLNNSNNVETNNETTIDNSSNKVHIIVEQNNTASLSTEEKSQRRHKRWTLVFKIFLLCIVFFLLGWSIYSFVVLFSNNKKSSHTYLLLDGKNYNQSKAVYDSFGTSAQTSNKKKLNDYYLIGTQLFVSESAIDPTLYSQMNNSELICGKGNDDIALYNITNDEIFSINSSTDIADKKFSIDLNYASDGDYLIYPKKKSEKKERKDYYPYSINKDETIYLENYSLPNEFGSRRKITIKNNNVSPYTLVSIFDAGSVLPSMYYDVIIYPSYYDSTLNVTTKDENFIKDVEDNIVSKINAETNNRYKIKVCSSIFEARNYHSVLSIALTSESNILKCSSLLNSYYKNNNFTSSVLTFSDSISLLGYDRDPDIRENMGLLTKSGSCYATVTGNNLFEKDENRIAKESFIVSKDRLLDTYNIILRTKF